MNWVLLISALVTLAVLVGMVGFYRWLGWTRAVESRLQAATVPVEAEARSARGLTGTVNRQLRRMSYGERLERQLVAADTKLSAGEFVIIRLTAFLSGFALGLLISGSPIAGLLLAIVGWIIPGIWLNRKIAARAKLFADQLPDMLTMLTGSLRSGYGLLYAMTLIEKEMPEPIASEFGRVIRETALGYSIGDALDHLVERVQNDDLALIVTAIHIQNEVGGSLAEVLETISRTIRDRIQLKGQIRAITSQQRATGSLLSALPFIVGTIIFLMSPGYMSSILQPGWPLMIPIVATIMVILGNIVMNRVTAIDV